MKRIVEIHEKCDIPAALFMVAGLLEKQEADYVVLLICQDTRGRISV